MSKRQKLFLVILFGLITSLSLLLYAIRNDIGGIFDVFGTILAWTIVYTIGIGVLFVAYFLWKRTTDAVRSQLTTLFVIYLILGSCIVLGGRSIKNPFDVFAFFIGWTVIYSMGVVGLYILYLLGKHLPNKSFRAPGRPTEMYVNSNAFTTPPPRPTDVHGNSDLSTTPPPLHKSTLPTGGVYLLKSGQYYKIGKANVFDNRIKRIALQLPEPVTVVHKIYSHRPHELEQHWHRRFATKRKNGEWFALTDDDIAEFSKKSFM